MKKFFEGKFIPVATKIANQRHILALRDGIILTMPLLIIASLFIIISDFPVEGYQNFMTGLFGEGWGDFVWNDVVVATTSLIAVIATFGAQVVDSFYVKDMFGLKLHQQTRRDALEKKLRQAIREGAERAEG